MNQNLRSRGHAAAACGGVFFLPERHLGEGWMIGVLGHKS
jgi:hypothetical protein